jgi:hypothetical protein
MMKRGKWILENSYGKSDEWIDIETAKMMKEFDCLNDMSPKPLPTKPVGYDEFIDLKPSEQQSLNDYQSLKCKEYAGSRQKIIHGNWATEKFIKKVLLPAFIKLKDSEGISACDDLIFQYQQAGGEIPQKSLDEIQQIYDRRFGR